MANTKGQTERRKYRRYPIQTDSFVTLGPYHTIVGQIMDISMGGLAFRYIGNKRPSDESHLDVFAHDFSFGFCDVAFETVSDYEIDNTVLCKTVDPMAPACRVMRRSGVKFKELTPRQVAQLEYFIQNHAIAEPADTYSMIREHAVSQESLQL